MTPRRHHAVGRADEELGFQHIAQPVERVAHRWLAEADFLPCPRDVALLNHRVEGDESRLRSMAQKFIPDM
jgi:hypothetical protein